MLAERAYVDMSHFPPGLEISASQTDGAHKAKIKIAVKNYGRTPAEVRSVVLAVLARTGTLPDAPPYSGAANLGGEAFLMPGESFMVTVGWPGAPLPTTTASLRDVEMSGDGSAMTTWCPHVPSWRLRRESETRRRPGVANAGRWLWRRQDRTPYAPRGDAGCRAGVVDYWAGGPALGHGEERALPRMQLVVCFANSLTAAACCCSKTSPASSICTETRVPKCSPRSRRTSWSIIICSHRPGVAPWRRSRVLQPPILHAATHARRDRSRTHHGARAARRGNLIGSASPATTSSKV